VQFLTLDETSLSPNQKGKFVLAEKGKKTVTSIVSESREHLTIIVHASANGQTGNPMFIAPRKINNFLGNHFPGSKIGYSSSGYMNDLLFVEWSQHFVKNIEQILEDSKLWCLLVLNPLTSHHGP